MTMTTMLFSSSKRFSLVLLLLVPLLAGATIDWFGALDTDHDGSINRQEYDEGMLKLGSALDGAVPAAGGSGGAAGAFLASLNHGSFWKGFSSGVAMILATEIGDKTFFIAAVLSMRHDRLAVFGGAILALIVMTILSSAMGLILPQFLDRQYTHILGGILFLYFGVKLVVESRAMAANRVSEELEEVEEELMQGKKKDADNEDPEEPRTTAEPSNSAKMSPYQVFLQALMLTFLAEWGDRSQIATIALSAAKNPYGVTVGGCIGHSMCTGLAVMGGRMLAARISEKTVSLYGGIIFLVFGVHSIFFES